ncbi:MAG TPA: hypothetical protein VGG45_16115 [Terracidiphilus sp.]
MKRAILFAAHVSLAVVASAVWQSEARAQSTPPLLNVVTACGSPNSTYSVGRNMPQTQDQNGNGCTSGTFTGTVVSAPTNSAGAYSGVTVGTSSGSILAASTAKVFADFHNQSPTATICISTTNPATITGTACAAGEITLPPLWDKSFEGTYVPSDQWFAIASAASTPLTVGAK